MRAFAIAIVAFLPLHTLAPQDVYTILKDRGQIETFSRVSSRLVCQCGCHMALSQCPHVECPWGIPARRFIESRVMQGDSADSIVAGFEKGFGLGIKTDPFVRQLTNLGRDDIVQGLVLGFGRSVRAESSLLTTIVAIGSFALAALVLGHWWLRRRKAAMSAAVEKGQTDVGTAARIAAPMETLLEKIRKIDQ